MTKAKTNALEALRSLIAERQQYDQWIAALDAKREGTPEHVFERVNADYRSRLERVVSEIRGHSEELQLSISTLSARLVEVAREEDTRREGLQEAELRAAVGEYEPEQWNQLRQDAEKALEKIAADRASLDGQLGELRAIQKLSEAGGPEPAAASAAAAPAPPPQPAVATVASETPPAPPRAELVTPAPGKQDGVAAARSQENLSFDSAAKAAAPPASPTPAAARPRTGRTPPSGVPAVRSKSEVVKPDTSKTLKCPECGTPNYPTEWYCERCGGELATM